jgi:hypothetical protein
MIHKMFPLLYVFSRPRLQLAKPLASCILILGLMSLAGPLYAQGSFAGVYTGTFSGISDNGEFAVLVRPDNSAVALFHDAFDETGGVRNLDIDNSGNFSFEGPPPFDTISGQISGDNITGTICCSQPGTLAGTRSADSGPFEDSGGLYVGEITGSGTEDGVPLTFDGQIYAIVDAPGKMMIYVAVDVFTGNVFLEVGETGGLVMVAPNGSIDESLPDGVMLNGGIDMANFTSAGEWSFSEPGASQSGSWNASRSEALPMNPGQTNIDATGVTDISGDAVPDVAVLSQLAGKRPRVRYYSGANRKKFAQVAYLSNAWAGVAAATLADGNQDGVANDPAVAVLGRRLSNDRLSVQVLAAAGGAEIGRISFLNNRWTPVDVVVIDDANGDGVTDDTAIGVLGFNPARPSQKKTTLQVRRLSDGSLLREVFFNNVNWTPLAAGAVQRPGKSPLMAVLAERNSNKELRVQARLLSDGSLQRNKTFLSAPWRQDVSECPVARPGPGDSQRYQRRQCLQRCVVHGAGGQPG